MECLGFEPGAAGWKAQMKPRSYGGLHVVSTLARLEGSQHYKHWLVSAKTNLPVST